MSRVPIRLRVTAAFALAMAVVLAASGWFLYARLQSHLTLALDRDLQLRAQDLAALVQQSSGSLAEDSRSALVERGESYAQLVDGRARVLDATEPLGRAPVLTARDAAAALQGPAYRNRKTVHGLNEPSRILAVPISRGGHRLVLVVGATSENNAETLASLRKELVIAGPIALLLASLAGNLLAGAALRQVESMRRRAAAISAETPGERLPVPATGDELERLGTTLNAMLDRLEAGLERERDFVADAGHELRTPLALLRTELELALRHGESRDELRDAITSSLHEVDRLAQLADDLLLIASSERGKLPLRIETLDAGELFASVVSRFSWRTDASQRSVTARSEPGVRIRGDRVRLEQALGNLVDNALRHGAGRILLSSARRDGAVELHVRDEGAGFEPASLERAFERFSHGRRARNGGGAGLGLAIVRAIAEAHGGEAEATNLDGRGADVWIVVPAEPLRSAGAAPAAPFIVRSSSCAYDRARQIDRPGTERRRP